jgi:hypothetical protein
LGTILVFTGGFIIDIDHYLFAKKRFKQLLKSTLEGKPNFGEPIPGRINFFHSWRGIILVTIINTVIVFFNRWLGIITLLSYFNHVIITDCLLLIWTDPCLQTEKTNQAPDWIYEKILMKKFCRP